MFRRLAALSLALITFAGCATAASPSTKLSSDQPTATVYVDSENWTGFRIYAKVDDNLPERLGTIMSIGRTRIYEVEVPSSTSAVAFVVEEFATGETWFVDKLRIRPGDEIEVRVTNHLPHSFARYR